MHELVAKSVVELSNLLHLGKISAVELCKAHLAHIERTNPIVNSFITVAGDLALKEAKVADLILKQRGAQAHRLTGVPVAVKDLFLTKNIKTTCASRMLENFVAPYDATVISRLRRAGALIIGKTNLDEYAMGSSTESSVYGPCKNPWDLERSPGGSSGGSAVAVTLGQAPIALGTDTGGSVRQPAGLTGTIGFKPTYGRVSRYGVVAFASSLDQVGTFTRSIDDLAILLGAISGYDEFDATSMQVAVPDFYSEIVRSEFDFKRLRIGVPKNYFQEGLDSEVESQFEAALRNLELLGANLVELSLPHMKDSVRVYYVLVPAEASSNFARYDGLRYGYSAKASNLASFYAKSRGEGFGSEVKRRILIGTYMLSKGYYDAYYKKAQTVRTLIINDFKAAFTNICDIIVTPVNPKCASKFGTKQSPLEMYFEDIFTIPANLADPPAISIPIGLNGKRLPIGMQFMAPPFGELRLLQVAKKYLDHWSFDSGAMISHFI